MLLTYFALLGAVRAEPISEDRRTFSDQTVQERWTWEDTQSPQTLVRKEWFHQSGQRVRLEEYRGGVLHGRTATWSASGLLETEQSFADGALHGADREWSGSEDERWVRVARNHQHGNPHGEQLRRSDADTIQLRHAYVDGRLHGRQQAWHPGGEMHYDLFFDQGVLHGEQRIWQTGELDASTAMVFDQGRPHGEQRYFTDSDWRTETWVEGRWEDVRSWHTEDEVPDSVRVYELETQALAVYRSAADDGPPPPAQALYLSAEKILVVQRTHWPSGTRKQETERTGDRRHREWAENGQLVLDGLGDSVDRRGLWTEWRPDGSLHHEEDWTGRRQGTIRTFDPQERLREVETWDYERTRWDLILYEGDVRTGEGELWTQPGRYRSGTWTWYRTDGSVHRTEVYGHGPYSGNRPYVVESEELAPDGSTRCSGDERKLRCVEPHEDGGSVELSVTALYRPRHGYDVYEPESFSFRRREVEQESFSEQAVLVKVLDGDGLVRSRRHLDASGAEQLHEQWRRDGTMEQVQGLGALGPWADHYDRAGILSTIEESLGDSASCTLQLDDGAVVRAWVTEADGSVVLTGQGRAADRRVAACPAWRRHPELVD
jgi:antitoxin component YwqK of YwqJK toxin-antitoxin module